MYVCTYAVHNKPLQTKCSKGVKTHGIVFVARPQRLSALSCHCLTLPHVSFCPVLTPPPAYFKSPPQYLSIDTPHDKSHFSTFDTSHTVMESSHVEMMAISEIPAKKIHLKRWQQKILQFSTLASSTRSHGHRTSK